jgi:hypothetical protein
MNYRFRSVKEELLSEDTDDALHQVLRLMHSGFSRIEPTPTGISVS